MSLKLRWVGAGEDELDRVAETRMRCYAQSADALDHYRSGIRADPRAGAGDFLLAEEAGQAVGTATSMPLTIWVREAPLACQGVAYVGTIKTHRRGSARASGASVATRLMHETLRLARERGEVVSALMPFRASFYEHFGYGLVERRHDWTVPLSILPAGASDGLRFYEPADLPELRACRQRVVRTGQCDIERSDTMWDLMLARARDGFVIVDRPSATGPVRGWTYFRNASANEKDRLRVLDMGYEDVPGLLRLLHFFGGLRDQYLTAWLSLPAEVQLNRLLRETQLPHRAVTHPVAECRPCTRLQLRVLDHQRFIEPMRLPGQYRGGVSVAVHETAEGEGRGPQTSRFRIELNDGHARVIPNSKLAAGDFECSDTTWAAVVCGDLPATSALRLGLAQGSDASVALLDAFAQGPTPSCNEAF